MSKSAKEIAVRWKEPCDNGSSISNYQIEYGKATISVPSSTLEYTLTNLDAGTTYRIRVQAKNDVGYGPVRFVRAHPFPSSSALQVYCLL